MSNPITKTRLKRRMLVSVITTVSLTGLYAYLYNLTFGMILTLTFILLSVFSYITVKHAISGLRGEVSVSSDIVSKGDTVNIRVTLETSAAFFIPFLYVSLTKTPHFTAAGRDTDIIVTIWRKNPGVIDFCLTAVMWGGAVIGIGQLCAKDYMGLFEFEITCEDLLAGVFVRPELIESQNNGLSAYLSNILLTDDNDDITGDKPSIAAWPGYTHRPYAPPDPPNRINWKLYARLDKLMVRETEYVKNQSAAIILDSQSAGDGPDCYETHERVIEGLLAHLISMTHIGFISDVRIYTETGGWQVFSIAEYTDIEALCEYLARYSFTDTPAPGMPDEEELLVIFTADPENAAAVYSGGIIVTPGNVSSALFPGRDLWHINEIYDITNIK